MKILSEEWGLSHPHIYTILGNDVTADIPYKIFTNEMDNDDFDRQIDFVHLDVYKPELEEIQFESLDSMPGWKR